VTLEQKKPASPFELAAKVWTKKEEKRLGSGDHRARMGQRDADAEEDRAADDRPENLAAESAHVVLPQFHD
jgi:hypothetical protein